MPLADPTNPRTNPVYSHKKILRIDGAGKGGFFESTKRSEVHRANHYTIETSYKKRQIFHVDYYNVLLFGRVKIQNLL